MGVVGHLDQPLGIRHRLGVLPETPPQADDLAERDFAVFAEVLRVGPPQVELRADRAGHRRLAAVPGVPELPMRLRGPRRACLVQQLAGNGHRVFERLGGVEPAVRDEEGLTGSLVELDRAGELRQPRQQLLRPADPQTTSARVSGVHDATRAVCPCDTCGVAVFVTVTATTTTTTTTTATMRRAADRWQSSFDKCGVWQSLLRTSLRSRRWR